MERRNYRFSVLRKTDFSSRVTLTGTRNIVGKEQHAGYLNFLLFPWYFQKLFFFWSLMFLSGTAMIENNILILSPILGPLPSHSFSILFEWVEQSYSLLNVASYLTHFHTMPHFNPLKIYSCRKHCEKKRNCLSQAISLFLSMFSTLYGAHFSFWMHFKMLSAICFTLDQSNILLSGSGLSHKYHTNSMPSWYYVNVCYCSSIQIVSLLQAQIQSCSGYFFGNV